MTIQSTITITAEDSFVDARIPAHDCDSGPANLEITTSIGEFDGILVGIATSKAYESAELRDAASAKAAIDAIRLGAAALGWDLT